MPTTVDTFADAFVHVLMNHASFSINKPWCADRNGVADMRVRIRHAWEDGAQLVLTSFPSPLSVAAIPAG